MKRFSILNAAEAITELRGEEVAAEWRATFITLRMPERMRRCMDVTGVQIAEVAEVLGVSRATVSNWLNGHTKPKTRQLQRWAQHFSVPLSWLTDGVWPEDWTPDMERPVTPMEEYLSKRGYSGTPARWVSPAGAAARPKGLEPPTFWLVSNQAETCMVSDAVVIDLAVKRALRRAS